jgi:translation initiation factor IF-1
VPVFRLTLFPGGVATAVEEVLEMNGVVNKTSADFRVCATMEDGYELVAYFSGRTR